MRLLIIRHGDPDYAIDSLTERGEKEAKALARMAPSMNIGHCYVSPLGRPRKTASYSLETTGKTAVTPIFTAKNSVTLYTMKLLISSSVFMNFLNDLPQT